MDRRMKRTAVEDDKVFRERGLGMNGQEAERERMWRNWRLNASLKGAKSGKMVGFWPDICWHKWLLELFL
jgi:hypothetical protein